MEDIINGNASTQVLNRGGIESRGFELTAAWTGRNFDVYGTYAWQQAEWQDDDPGQGIRSGEQVLDIPEHSFFAELGWRPMENFRTALNVKYTASVPAGTSSFRVSATGFSVLTATATASMPWSFWKHRNSRITGW